jgi:hydrogenase maturation protease
MRSLYIAIGNPLRGDDGVARAVLERLPPGVDSREVLQLLPEMADEIAAYDRVVFIDADRDAKVVRIEPVIEQCCEPAITHTLSPAALVGLSRSLFGFSGKAFLCRIPARDFTFREALNQETSMAARAGSEAIVHAG